ncbi:FAD-dependent monooxygenase [Amycolatopsis regifaucium]|uniref:FAD-binding domain-containing protein n=1 Tax=Amycolatopsis regifaucium TaxID=546365 RepID=A0A154MVN5_9PSEU|nr:FAD-dependent monooxygenase [Amycolatopsis regifaucium]KZB88341.1 hypothetical protein AVL48_20555 [Amycolatopsis regifaucium]OKA11452.1 hypothetical protein ATP06_0200945 [Amycolatopsis regifaucium]SFH41439.1 FAD binding domain-containing protein [Amycolatopsis regifaucium]
MPNEPQRVLVLIVGGGLAGLASSLFLARHGVRAVLVERWPGVRSTGGGDGVDQRTMEIYRALGLEEAIRGDSPPVRGRWPDLCPCAYHEGERHEVEPVLLEAARRRGADARFGTELVSIATDADGADAVLLDRVGGRRDVVRADYVIAAEGAGGLAAAALAIRLELQTAERQADPWPYPSGTAESFRVGRVFLVGDSAHRWPEDGALRAGLAVQEAHNVAWKIAGVIHGWAGPGLLDSYETERRPVALEVEKRLSRWPTWTPPAMNEAEEQVLTLGQRYPEGALAGDRPASVFGDRLGVRACPGERAPHLWLERAGARLSTHDLFDGSFVLLTTSGGVGWTSAATRIASRRCLPLRAYRLGRSSADADFGDVQGRAPDRYPIGDDGAVLIRPDGYVGWLTDVAPESPELVLGEVFDRLLR